MSAKVLLKLPQLILVGFGYIMLILGSSLVISC